MKSMALMNPPDLTCISVRMEFVNRITIAHVDAENPR